MRIHFIAIGGSAMHNLALALHQKGYKITGSDDAIFEPSKSRLEKVGLLPTEMGWFVSKITIELDAVILGMHAKNDNPELLKAQELGIKIFSYPEFLFEQSKDKTRVVVGGSHGKTTITSMILHVMNYHERKVDFMVGALLEGFDTMVKLTKENDFIVLEGDEYLTSPIDLRPKFHLYQPNIALLSGIAWDHINVFPTFENYVYQFEKFIETITDGGILVYNEEDKILKEVVEKSNHTIKKFPYKTPNYTIENSVTFLDTSLGKIPLAVFGSHNLQNLEGAKWVCLHMGLSEEDFYEAISTFKGANKRLEKLLETTHTVLFKDFAHSPSKVLATTYSVKEQFPNRTLIACLELHTYSSLNANFLNEYENALNAADIAVVYYSPDAVAIKRLNSISAQQIKSAFRKEDLSVFTNPDSFKEFLFSLDFKDATVLMMSSGNYGNLDFEELKSKIKS